MTCGLFKIIQKYPLIVLLSFAFVQELQSGGAIITIPEAFSSSTAQFCTFFRCFSP